MSDFVRPPMEPAECQTCWLRITQRELSPPSSDSIEGEWRYQLGAALACACFAAIAWFVTHQTTANLLYALAYMAGSWFAAAETIDKLRERSIDVHFLMLAVAAGAAAIGQWTEGAVLLFLFSFAGALEHFALERTQREIRALIHSAPKKATLITPDGSEVEVAVESLQIGQRIRILPGALFPVDGEIVRGTTAADESALTGESISIEKQPGDSIMAGTLNLWGAVDVGVTRIAEQSALRKIIRLIQEAQKQKAPSQRFTDRFGSGYTIGILSLTAGMFFYWWHFRHMSAFASSTAQSSAFYHAMTLLVVASPCALVLSIPSAILAAIAAGARQGVLFRGGAAVEQLAAIDIVAMDKTGTLTTGELRVEKVESFPPGRELEVGEWAFALERLSTHPLARAIAEYGKRHKLAERPLTRFASLTGLGLEAESPETGLRIRLGRREWALEPSDAESIGGAADAAAIQTSEVWLSCVGGQMRPLVGKLSLRDDIRPAAADTVTALHRRGLKTVVLTGDRAASAAHLKAVLGVGEIRAQLKPEEKLAFISGLSREGHRVAMIGDGINDAPSLAAAHVGVAMGARGSDAALEQADLVLMHDRLENFLVAYDLSFRARRVILQNLCISLGVLLVLLALALTGSVPLTLGILGHEGSTLIVVINSLRLMSKGKMFAKY
jgi:Cd2+/Zn2+-exporting ATPase